MKKFLTGVLVALTVVFALSGCAGKADVDDTVIKIGSLKGPTSMGLLYLMEQNENYEFTIATAADEILPKVVSGEIDIALVPANVASVLYNKTNGGVTVIDINTLGVLYAVGGDESIGSVADLKGKTVYVTNKGTTPDYVFQFLLSGNNLNLSEVNMEYKSEAAEVAALLKENPDAVGILPQPFVTAACMGNENLKVLLNLTEEWDKLSDEESGRLVTGVTIVRNDFLKEHEGAVKSFLKAHKESAEYAVSNPEATAALVVKAGIIEKEPVALKALPNCSITYIDGPSMKEALSGYLKVLYDLDSTSVGGSLPGEEFYY